MKVNLQILYLLGVLMSSSSLLVVIYDEDCDVQDVDIGVDVALDCEEPLEKGFNEPHIYHDGKFVTLVEAPMLTGEGGRERMMKTEKANRDNIWGGRAIQDHNISFLLPILYSVSICHDKQCYKPICEIEDEENMVAILRIKGDNEEKATIESQRDFCFELWKLPTVSEVWKDTVNVII
ncbi:hypothetical protein BD769DRAFT_1395699 [Suillus cothurnatus]|nr:hypothetical protein BD769DRAFT_1395699 [Suillus cothurnatus]